MEKYDKLFKGLEMCAGPECCKDGCPYYGETRGGKTCRAWLLHDAMLALADLYGRNESQACDIRCWKARVEQKNEAIQCLIGERDDLRKALETKTDRPAVCSDAVEMAGNAAKLLALAEYWRGQADALKWFMTFYFADNAAEDDAEPEAEADANV